MTDKNRIAIYLSPERSQQVRAIVASGLVQKQKTIVAEYEDWLNRLDPVQIVARRNDTKLAALGYKPEAESE